MRTFFQLLQKSGCISKWIFHLGTQKCSVLQMVKSDIKFSNFKAGNMLFKRSRPLSLPVEDGKTSLAIKSRPRYTCSQSVVELLMDSLSISPLDNKCKCLMSPLDENKFLLAFFCELKHTSVTVQGYERSPIKMYLLIISINTGLMLGTEIDSLTDSH